ncbi:MAG: HD domain-containing protein [Oscillospiraceae bacterium]|jgi:metal-dependent HD superfamily phosphatase/phosphodiesterase|nr:HD domain-containing protein [Oscillospiraceae bacterium]
MVTYETVLKNKDVKTYIEKADETLIALGYTEHSYAHVGKASKMAGDMLIALGYPERTAELARIAGHMHDIGNVVNRIDHAQSGAVMAFRLLDKMGMDADELATVVTAIGHHDESTAFPVNEVAAALILADKSDVRRSRVRNTDRANFDIHDRVNYAVEKSELTLSRQERTITLDLDIDSSISAVMDYFEIFLGRMILCRRAANHLGLKFRLVINGVALL